MICLTSLPQCHLLHLEMLGAFDCSLPSSIYCVLCRKVNVLYNPFWQGYISAKLFPLSFYSHKCVSIDWNGGPTEMNCFRISSKCRTASVQLSFNTRGRICNMLVYWDMYVEITFLEQSPILRMGKIPVVRLLPHCTMNSNIQVWNYK